jgi:hypothetical protein
MTAPILTPPEVVAPLRAIFGHHVARPAGVLRVSRPPGNPRHSASRFAMDGGSDGFHCLDPDPLSRLSHGRDPLPALDSPL